MNRELGLVIENVWPESSTENLDKLNGTKASILFTLCPLYLLGPLSESGLMLPPASITESRVARKWQALTDVVSVLDNYFKSIGGRVNLTAVFASRGVLLASEPDSDHQQAIIHHNDIYQEAIEEFCKSRGIEYNFVNYHELQVNIPDFVDPNSQIPEVDDEGNSKNPLVNAINRYLENQQIPSHLLDNKNNRRLVSKIASIEGVGLNGAFWLIAGYMAFDYMIPTLAGNNGLYLATERFEPLFGISHFTLGLKAMPRVKIKA